MGNHFCKSRKYIMIEKIRELEIDDLPELPKPNPKNKFKEICDTDSSASKISSNTNLSSGNSKDIDIIFKRIY